MGEVGASTASETDLRCCRRLHWVNSLLSVVSVAAQNLPQLYRFCFLMTGEASKAQDIFQDTLREAAFLAAKGEPPANRYWFFREARWRCLDVVAHGVQPEQGRSEERRVGKECSSGGMPWH